MPTPYKEFNLEIMVNIEEEDTLESIFKALSPELKDMGKVKVSLKKDKKLLIIELNSTDISKVKAITSSLTRCIFSMKETLDKLKGEFKNQ